MKKDKNHMKSEASVYSITYAGYDKKKNYIGETSRLIKKS